MPDTLINPVARKKMSVSIVGNTQSEINTALVDLYDDGYEIQDVKYWSAEFAIILYYQSFQPASV